MQQGTQAMYTPHTPVPLRFPAHLLSFLSWEASHPRVTLQKENLVSRASRDGNDVGRRV